MNYVLLCGIAFCSFVSIFCNKYIQIFYLIWGRFWYLIFSCKSHSCSLGFQIYLWSLANLSHDLKKCLPSMRHVPIIITEIMSPLLLLYYYVPIYYYTWRHVPIIITYLCVCIFFIMLVQCLLIYFFPKKQFNYVLNFM